MQVGKVAWRLGDEAGYRWKRRHLSPEQQATRNQPHKCRECGKPATRHYKHTYYYCSEHWHVGGLIVAAKKEGYRKTLGKERADAWREFEQREKRRFNSQAYARSMKGRGR